MLELHPLHYPTIPYVEAGDDPRQQSRGRAGEGRSGRALRSCEPALEQRRAVCARQLGMELAGKETLAALLQRRDEIGRASCRERGTGAGVEGTGEEKGEE